MTMIDFLTVSKTKAIPHGVYGGKVHSFQMPFVTIRVFDGNILKLSSVDGLVYAVFENETEADNWNFEFQGCVRYNFDGYMNAYCVSQ
jgi:hypothetical protein